MKRRRANDYGQVFRSLLVTSLLQYPDSMAAVVDTTGNFDVLRLYALILARLRGSPEIVQADGGTSVEDLAAKVLDRVKIMRVFDFVGVREAVGEIREELEGRKASRRQEEKARDEPVVEEEPLVPEEPSLPKRTVVADSEDEDEDEEMLFDTSTPSAAPAPAVQHPPQPETNTTPQEAEPEATPSKTKFILIDNLAQVLNPLLKKDYIQGPFPSLPFPLIQHTY
jgi:hypothetical protein